MELFGEGQYNLQSLKEIVVTDSFMGLARDARKCQNIETVDECTTRLYVENFRQQCGCLPLTLKMSEKVQCSSVLQRIMKMGRIRITNNIQKSKLDEYE